ncbi:MAG TPA: methyltransferase domain-containing protein [Oleiagrimonas sp.]|nr:methyltransferase domain-containing protein [Oleiagrimonas sp.]
MSDPSHVLMQLPPATRLHAAESVALARALAGQAGDHGLYLGVTGRLAKGLPRMGCWTHLRMSGHEYAGDVRARVDESLPFADETFRVVVLSHVLEWTPHAADLLEEAIRVLAPEGLLAVTAFHPFSAWTPWLLCRRAPRPMLIAPAWLRQRLASQAMLAPSIHRCGAPLPARHGVSAAAWLGGGFVLIARKRRAAIMKLQPHARRRGAGQRGAWVHGTHRECA